MKKIITVLLLLTSCSFIQETRVNNAISYGKKHFLDGNYREAIITCYESLKDYPNNRELINFCTSVFADVKTVADHSYKKGDYKKAGMLYRYLLDYRPANLKIEIEELRALKGECVKRLSERALYNYRRGYLEEAISTWSEILEIDPSNSEAKKSIATASMQLKNIKGIQ